ncbi:MAG TPA: hypothetical protein VF594_03860 [Rubricoccaceae bacterium]|jgi:hypothetical protein
MRSRSRLGAVLTLSVLLGLAGCKGRGGGVAVTEAPPVGFPSAAERYAEGDTVYAAYADSLAADSLAADSLAAASTPRVAAADSTPDFRPFWAAFRAAVRSGRRPAVTALTRVGPGGIAPAAWPSASGAFLDEPFRTPLLALDANALAREGDARVATVVVGFDAEGAVVPEDEADTDSAVVLRFEIVADAAGAAWRLVRVDTAG